LNQTLLKNIICDLSKGSDSLTESDSQASLRPFHESFWLAFRCWYRKHWASI